MLQALAAMTAARAATVSATPSSAMRFAPVDPHRALVFPQDFGAHPAFRTEWWYVTGWLERPGAAPCGFQFTLFRSRTPHDDANPSRFAPKQLLSAHVALALPEHGRLLHAQRAAREGFGLAHAREGNTDVAIGDWSLVREDDLYDLRANDRELALQLRLRAVRPPLLQGDAGTSRKGPRPEQSSHYYSQPHLQVDGRIEAAQAGARRAWPVTGLAWLDHEWSSTLLDERAAGWDWVGLNLHDGASLMAFRIRAHDGATLWSHASWADAQGAVVARGESAWRTLRGWRSPRSGATYPVATTLQVGAATIELQPLLDDQEVDGRASTGTLYWEGAVRALHRGREIGRGYLELTGYASRIRL